MAKTKQLPTSEALRGLGVLLRYFISAALWQVLNPRGIAQSVLQVGGQLVGQVRWLLHHKAIQPVPMALPFDDEWHVLNGSVDKASSHSWSVVAQRYAYDFVISDAENRNYTGSGLRVQDYLCWGRDILAPADGVVIAMRNDVHDSPHLGGWVDVFTPDIRGNHVVIQHAPNVFSLLAHLQQGSVMLKPGDDVKRGQVVGRCGNSGHSTEPHLHFHVQDHPNFYLAVGLPVLFQNVEQRNPSLQTHETSERMAQGYIGRGRTVRSVPHLTDGSTVTAFIYPQLSWADPVVSLVIALFVLRGLYVVADLLIHFLRGML